MVGNTTGLICKQLSLQEILKRLESRYAISGITQSNGITHIKFYDRSILKDLMIEFGEDLHSNLVSSVSALGDFILEDGYTVLSIAHWNNSVDFITWLVKPYCGLVEVDSFKERGFYIVCTES